MQCSETFAPAPNMFPILFRFLNSPFKSEQNTKHERISSFLRHYMSLEEPVSEVSEDESLALPRNGPLACGQCLVQYGPYLIEPT